MTGDLLGSFSALELIWTGLALVGIVFSVANIRDAGRDFLALGGKRNGRRRITLGDLRRETIRLVYYVFAILGGILAGAQPARDGTPSTAGLVIISLLILMSLLQTSQSVFDRLDRQYLMRFGLTPRDEKGRFTSNE